MGARGRVYDELTPEFVLRLARTASIHWESDRVAVGRDTRSTGDLFENVTVAGLESAGADVDRLGVVPTPAVQQYAAREAVPALVVTASHNPPDHNGVKLVGRDGSVLDPDAVATVRTGMDDTTPVAWNETGGSRRVEGAGEAYVAGVIDAVSEDRERVADYEPTVVVDPGNGAGAATTPAILRALGCRIRTIHAQQDGWFPGRAPEPVAEALGDLSAFVSATDADLGIAHDGDADRVVFVDETGEFVEGDTAFAALAAEALGPDDIVVTTVNASQRLIDVAEDAGASVEYTPIGNSYVLRRVRELRADGRSVPIAGEGNGGIIYPDYHLGRDGGYVAARFVAFLSDRSATEALDPYRGYRLVRENIPYDSDAERDTVLDRAAEWAETRDCTVSTMDGYRVDFEEAWVMIRPSGTEPYVRVYAEAPTSERARDLVREVRRAVE